MIQTTRRGPFLDPRTGRPLHPRLVTWDPETGEFTCVDGPKGFAAWEEAEEAGRFLSHQQPRERQTARLGK